MLHTDDEQKPTALSRLEEHKRDCKKQETNHINLIQQMGTKNRTKRKRY